MKSTHPLSNSQLITITEGVKVFVEVFGEKISKIFTVIEERYQSLMPLFYQYGAPIVGIWVFHVIKITLICQVCMSPASEHEDKHG